MKRLTKKVLVMGVLLSIGLIVLSAPTLATPDRGDDCRTCHAGHNEIGGVYPMTVFPAGTKESPGITVRPGEEFQIMVTTTLSNTIWRDSDLYLYYQPDKADNLKFTFTPNLVRDNAKEDKNRTLGDMHVVYTVKAPTTEGVYDAKIYGFLKGQGSDPGEGFGPLHADTHTWVRVAAEPLEAEVGALAAEVSALEKQKAAAGSVTVAIVLSVIALMIAGAAIFLRRKA